MDIKAIKDGIYAEFVANADLKTALGGDTERRMYDGKAKQDPNFPYCVYQYTSGSPSGTFSEDGEITFWQFDIYHQSESPLNTTTIDDVLKKLLACYDDIQLTISGYNCTAVSRNVSNFIPSPDDMQRYMVVYEIMIQEN